MSDPTIVISYRASYYDRWDNRTADSNLEVRRFDSGIADLKMIDYIAGRIRADTDAPMINILVSSLADLAEH